MTLPEAEGVHDAVELLVEALHGRSAAALLRSSQLGPHTARQAAMVLRVESEARWLQAGLWGASRGDVRGRLVELTTAAAEFDVEFPDGGLLLSSEHGEHRQMTQALVAHLVGEFSFAFLSCEAADRFRAEAALVLNTICSLHLSDWKQLGLSAAVAA